MFRRLKYHIAVFFPVIGPGFIAAVVDNDAGGIFTYSQNLRLVPRPPKSLPHGRGSESILSHTRPQSRELNHTVMDLGTLLRQS